MANPLILMLPLFLLTPQQPDPARGVIVQPFLEVEVPRQIIPRPPVRPRLVVPPPLPGRFAITRNNKRIYLEPKPVPSTGADEDEPAAAPGWGGALNLNEMAIASETFDQSLFGGSRSPESLRTELRQLLVVRVKRLDGMWPLTPDQVNRLMLAGTGDIQRFLDRVEESRREFEAARHDYNAGLAVIDRLEPLAQIYQGGTFGAKSMFMKAFGKILADAKLPVKPASQGS